MTVAQLITILKQMPLDSDVLIRNNDIGVDILAVNTFVTDQKRQILEQEDDIQEVDEEFNLSVILSI